MKVLIINSVIDYGSTGRICNDAAKYLIKNGHEVRIAYGRTRAIFDDSFNIGYRIGSGIGVRIHGLLTRFFDLHGCGSKIATKRFLKWADLYKPDVVWLHNLHGYYINYKLLFRWLKDRNVKVLWTLHDCWAITGHCTHFSFVGCQNWEKDCAHCPQKNQYPRTMISQSKKNLLEKKRVFTSLDDLTIVVPSLWLKNIVARSFLNKYPCVVINNGIDLNTFYIEKSSFREKYKIQYKKIILCISSIWSDRKGIIDVFKLSSLLNENEIIILVGQVNHHLFKLPENIIFIKRTNNTEELRKIYSSADVMFNPTYEDTYSNINMESISCGTPVVCYKTGGASEMLDSNFVVNQGSIIDALDVMRRIFKGELKINSQGKDFSHKKTIEEYEKLIIGNKVVIK